MCGINGILAFNEVGRINIINLVKATDVLEARGPDNRGFYNDYFVGLGHRRLSIIDVSDEANQPMEDPTGRFIIVFNGEIYNYRELRKELEAGGVRFRTQSDTEVLLQMYIRKGTDCLDRLNGFFAFAIYDRDKEELLLARDRIGIKPLFFFHDEFKFVFASEMKSMMAFGVDNNINYESLVTYLQLNYIPAPETIFKGISKLLPGHYLLVSKNNFITKAYYSIPKPAVNAAPISYESAKDRLRSLLEDAVQQRLVADVPLGAFLSGGIDSSIIVALAARHKPHLNTFSIGYADAPYFDETKYANLVAKHFQTEHTVFKLTNQDLRSHVFDILDYLDEPFADSSAIPVFILSKHTRAKATVALSGDGADELFGGYNKHAGFLKSLNGGFASRAVSGLAPLWKALPQSRSGGVFNKFRQLQRFAAGMQLPIKDRYWLWAGFARQEDAIRLLGENSRAMVDLSRLEQVRQQATRFLDDGATLNDMLYSDMHLVLTNDMLTKVDLMSMANSLEVRVPFLDHRVVDFAFTLPGDFKIRNGVRKSILRDAFREVLPAKLYSRPKHGFEVPLLKWFRKDLRSLIEDDLLSKQFVEDQGIFDSNETELLKRKLFSNSPGDIHARIWGMIVFQWWWKKYFMA